MARNTLGAHRLGGRPAGVLLMSAGALFVAVSFALVFVLANRAQAAAVAQVPFVDVVVALQDIPQHTAVRAGSVALRPFPPAYVPAGSATRLDQVVGKYVAADVAAQQVIGGAQLSLAPRASNLAAALPEGKVGFWLALPDILAQGGGLRPGDHVDILLSLSPGLGALSGLITQTTLQDVEVFHLGSATSPTVSGVSGVAKVVAGSVGGASQTERVAVLVLEPQQALLVKYIKDSGGTVDLILRGTGAHQRFETRPVTAQTVLDEFEFRTR